MKKVVTSSEAMKRLGEAIGHQLRGGEIIELVGDVGAGKTTLTKGIARGLGVTEDVQSPSFTISRVYDGRDGLRLSHYDFYRIGDAGIMANELADAMSDQQTIVIVEWADAVRNVLPESRLTVRLMSPSETTRELVLETTDEAVNLNRLLEKV